MKKNKNIVLGISGSIAAYKVCELVRLLKLEGHSVTCILTPAGEKFVTRITLQTLSGEKVYSDMFEEYSFNPEHISIAEKADIVVIAPATADIIAKLSCGIADNLLLSVVLATKAKILICPAMHTNMWEHPLTQKSIKVLKDTGYYILGPEKGKLVSGKTGSGRMVSVEEIKKKIYELIS